MTQSKGQDKETRYTGPKLFFSRPLNTIKAWLKAKPREFDPGIEKESSNCGLYTDISLSFLKYCISQEAEETLIHALTDFWAPIHKIKIYFGKQKLGM